VCCLRAMFLVLLLAQCGCAGAGPLGSQSEEASLDRELKVIHYEIESGRIFDPGYELYSFVKKRPADSYSEQEIQLIGDELSDKIAGMRYWAAAALGYIGPKAIIERRSLQRALEAETCTSLLPPRTTVTVRQAILGNMKRIGIEPEQVHCAATNRSSGGKL